MDVRPGNRIRFPRFAGVRFLGWSGCLSAEIRVRTPRWVNAGELDREQFAFDGGPVEISPEIRMGDADEELGALA